MPLRELFEAPRLSDLAARIEAACFQKDRQAGTSQPAPPPTRGHPEGPPPPASPPRRRERRGGCPESPAGRPQPTGPAADPGPPGRPPAAVVRPAAPLVHRSARTGQLRVQHPVRAADRGGARRSAARPPL